MRLFPIAAPLALLAACSGSENADNPDDSQTTQTVSETPENLADSMASNDDAAADASAIPDSEERPIMQLQVVLDRRGFGPGVIDGKMGLSTENALEAFQEANDLEITGQHDDATKAKLAQWDAIPATRIVTIPQSWAQAEYDELPADTAEKAELEQLGYESLDERLAERFHTTVEVLQMLNPGGRPAGADAETGEEDEASAAESGTEDNPPKTNRPGDSVFAAGQQIRVPNIGGDRIAPGVIEDAGWQNTLVALGVGTDQPDVDRIVVSKAGKTLKAYRGEQLMAQFTVSSGSSEFPLPLGNWDILGEAYNPPYSYDPEVLGKGEGETYQLPPGPNSPVGVVWIDLSKEHYGIHGTPDPETIGRAQSSGCVRLTNWDAARLAEMVSTDTKVVFEA